MQDAQSTYSNGGAPATPTAAQSVTGYPGDGLGSHKEEQAAKLASTEAADASAAAPADGGRAGRGARVVCGHEEHDGALGASHLEPRPRARASRARTPPPSPY